MRPCVAAHGTFGCVWRRLFANLAAGAYGIGETIMTRLDKLERASKTAYRQLNLMMSAAKTHAEYLPKLRRSNNIDRELMAIKLGEYDKELARKREIAKSLIARITKHLTEEDRSILRPYVSIMP
jgi:hypothetical protein